MAKDAGDAAAYFAAATARLKGLKQRAGRDLVAGVQGHYGDSTVSASTTGSGARVTIVGEDAAEQRAAVHAKAQAVLRKER